MVKAGQGDSYQVWLEPEVHEVRTKLPGNVRRRIKSAIQHLTVSPRPSTSIPIDVEGLDIPPGIEIRRLRLMTWRIIYAVNDSEHWVWVLGIKQRPPYKYENLSDYTELLKE